MLDADETDRDLIRVRSGCCTTQLRGSEGAGDWSKTAGELDCAIFASLCSRD
jgi:hypothetical protein